MDITGIMNKGGRSYLRMIWSWIAEWAERSFLILEQIVVRMRDKEKAKMLFCWLAALDFANSV